MIFEGIESNDRRDMTISICWYGRDEGMANGVLEMLADAWPISNRMRRNRRGVARAYSADGTSS